MRKLTILILAVLSLSMTGCVNMWLGRVIAESAATLTFYAAAPEAFPVEPTAKFNIGVVSDSSEYKFKNTFDPKEAMRASLQPRLEVDNVAGKDSPQYIVNVNIESYEVYTNPVEFSFNRAVMSVTATILDQEGNHRVIIASNAFGSVFDKIADGIVEVIRNPDKRIM